MPALSTNRTVSTKQFIRRATPVRNRHEHWAVILAGGDGTRLSSMTRAISGDDRPKQFCPIVGGSTLLDQTRRRVALSVLPSRTMFVFTEKHDRYYRSIATNVSKDLLVVQPQNKGTAPAILYALMRIATKAPRAIVALFPSDHYFADDDGFMSHVDIAYDAVQAKPETITLLGITPDGPEVEYGWIEPQTSILGSLPGSITRLRRFWEKPSASLAQNLLKRGCLWNSFVMVGRVDALLKMSRRALAEMYNSFAAAAPTFGTSAEAGAIRELYARIAETNFSHEVLAKRPEDLAVLRVGEVGWSDLGEPSRVLSTLTRIGLQTNWAMPAA